MRPVGRELEQKETCRRKQSDPREDQGVGD
jgi:hypothetical protein